METAYIYHITTRSWWEAAQPTGQLSSPRFEEEGYIHCATEQQIPGVLERYFKGQSDLVRLTIDKAKVKPPLVFELAGKLGLAPWQIDKARRQLNKWRPGMITFAINELARADAGVKGAAADPIYALEKSILAIAQRVQGGDIASV